MNNRFTGLGMEMAPSSYLPGNPATSLDLQLSVLYHTLRRTEAEVATTDQTADEMAYRLINSFRADPGLGRRLSDTPVLPSEAADKRTTHLLYCIFSKPENKHMVDFWASCAPEDMPIGKLIFFAMHRAYTVLRVMMNFKPRR